MGWGQATAALTISRIHLNIPFSDVSQKGDSKAVKLALLSFNKQLNFQEALKDLSNMENVFLGRTIENQNIVEVDKNKMIKHVPEHIIDQENSGPSVESHLPLISFAYPHKVVGIPKVQFGKGGSPVERFERRGEKW
jgi:hypothetical protein